MTSDGATLASLDDFDARGYLAEYYQRIEGENERLLAFHALAHSLIPSNLVMLEFGGGPTIYQLISACARAKEIHFSEYSPHNLREVQFWLNQHSEAFDWSPFVAAVLKIEGVSCDHKSVLAREQLLRERITKLVHGNAFEVEPLGESVNYDVVAANFVMEGITDNVVDWQRVFANVTNMVRPDGYFITTVVTGAEYWRLGEQTFAAALIDVDLLKKEIEGRGFSILHWETIDADVTDPTAPEYEGYNGMAMVVAQRRD